MADITPAALTVTVTPGTPPPMTITATPGTLTITQGGPRITLARALVEIVTDDIYKDVYGGIYGITGGNLNVGIEQFLIPAPHTLITTAGVILVATETLAMFSATVTATGTVTLSMATIPADTSVAVSAGTLTVTKTAAPEWTHFNVGALETVGTEVGAYA